MSRDSSESSSSASKKNGAAICPMGMEHAVDVADLHYRYIPSLLRDLGKSMCRALYMTAMKSNENFGFVYVKDSVVLGYTFGTTDNSSIFRSLRIRWEVILTLLRKPWLIPRVFGHLKGPYSPFAEILYSAVEPDLRGRGVGFRLRLAIHEEFKRRNLEVYQVRTDADNHAVLVINRKMGAEAENFLENGRPRVRLLVKVDQGF